MRPDSVALTSGGTPGASLCWPLACPPAISTWRAGQRTWLGTFNPRVDLKMPVDITTPAGPTMRFS